MELTTEGLQEIVRSEMSAVMNPEAFAAALAEAVKPAVRKDLDDVHGEEGASVAIKGARFFKTIYDHKFSGKALTDDIETATIDDDHAGYSVPTEVASDVAKVESQMSLARLECKYFPQKASSMTRMVKATGLSMTHPTEGGSGSYTKTTYSNRTFTKVKGIMIVPISNDLFSTSAVDMYKEIVEELAIGSAEDIDTYAFNDNTSPHTGILNGAGNSVYLGTAGTAETLATIASDDLYDRLVDVTTSLASKSLIGAKWCMSQTVLGQIRKMKTTTSQPIPVFETRLASDPTHIIGRVLGYPVIASDVMPSYTDGSSVATAIAWFGNPKQYGIGQNSDLVIDMSKDASVAVADGTVSAFQYDLTIMRGIVFRSANLLLPAAFVKLETATS